MATLLLLPESLVTATAIDKDGEVTPAMPGQAPKLRGLSPQEAAGRLAADGANELPSAERRTPLRIVAEVLREPMLALLLAAGTVYLLLGDLREAIILLIFATVSLVITVVQESRTERVLAALRDLSSPHALVIRDGERIRIPGREVVRGDLVVITEGDRVAADAVIRDCQDLQIDESLLTGESVPVRKIGSLVTGEDAPRCPGGDDLPYVFSGSLVVRGEGIAEVIATGQGTELGTIGQSLRALEMEPPRLKTQVRRIVQVFAVAGATVSALVVVLYGVFRGGWLDAVLAGIAVGMSMLPEEFPLVLAVFMAMGAWRISRARVLTRRAAAIETLGSATVLCTDKTGTLTQNRMSIAELRLLGGKRCRPAAGAAIPEAFLPLLDAGILASAADPYDPMEKAFHELGDGQHLLNGHSRTHDKRLVRTYGLRPELLAMSNAWADPAKPEEALIAAKGAPEAIADLCRLGQAERTLLLAGVETMAAEGMRVLGVARATFTAAALPESQRDFVFSLIGLVGLADPLRTGVPEAVAQCKSAGIRVLMITGDHSATARAIARQAGIDAEQAVTGDELAALASSGQEGRLLSATVFARILPNQKLSIVEALKARGEVVAMTGDGVNDAPSLKAAHIGIAMGKRGTDVAREASSIVLLDDDFASIVKAIQLGRRIYDNLRKAVGFIIAVHVPIAGLALLPLILGYPLVLGPVHIAFLEMLIDPVCSLAFEAEMEEEDIMRRPPRNPREALLSDGTIAWGLFQGGLALALVAGIFLVASGNGMPETEVRALAFFALVFSILGLIFVNRSYGSSLVKALMRPNPMLRVVLCIVIAMLGLTLLWPFARNLFRFGPLHANDLAITVAAGVAVLVVLEAAKLIQSRPRPGSRQSGLPRS